MHRRYCLSKRINAHSLLFKCELLRIQITVNWNAHSKNFVENSLRNLQNTNALARGNEWVVKLVQEYVVGNTEHIKNAVDMYRRCRLEFVDFRNEVNQAVAREIMAAAPPMVSPAGD